MKRWWISVSDADGEPLGVVLIVTPTRAKAAARAAVLAPAHSEMMLIELPHRGHNDLVDRDWDHFPQDQWVPADKVTALGAFKAARGYTEMHKMAHSHGCGLTYISNQPEDHPNN